MGLIGGEVLKWSYDAALLLVDYLYYSQNHTINQCNRAAENLAYCLTANSGVTEDDGTAIGYRLLIIRSRMTAKLLFCWVYARPKAPLDPEAYHRMR